MVPSSFRSFLPVGWVLAIGFVWGSAPGAAQALPPLTEYRSRLDVEPQVQLRTIVERCAALHGRLSVWTAPWDPEGARSYRGQADVFRAAAVRARAAGGASADQAAREAASAIDGAADLYTRHVGGGGPTAPGLEADVLIQGDAEVCRSMLDVIGEG